MKRSLLALIILVLGGGAWSEEPRFRADDGSFWRLADNPALGAVSGDVFSVGIAADPSQGRWDGTRELQVVSPLLSFRYLWDQRETSRLEFATTVGLGESFSLGYRSATSTQGSLRRSQYDFGLIHRPFDALSMALTVDDAFANRLWGAGLGLRPLTLIDPRLHWLTLTADGSWAGERPRLEQVGARLAWNGSDLRVWYDPNTQTPGLEVSLALGAAETTASWNRVGQAFRWAGQDSPRLDFGPGVLRINLGNLAAAPQPSSFRWGDTPVSLPEVIALLDRASSSGHIQAVVVENPPPVGGLASAEELRRAFERVKKAGKKVYLYADDYSDSLGFQGWMAVADRVSLHPTGSVWLTSSGSRRLYLKDFLEKVGIRFVNFAPWETKSANNALTFSSMPEAERSMLRRFLGDREELAVATLASGRGDRLKRPASELVAQGPWLVAQEALDVGLVDALETLSEFEASVRADLPGATFLDDLPPPRDRSWGPAVSRKTVALVHLAGDIVLGRGQAARSIGTVAIQTLEQLRTDPNIAAVVLRVDSPGGAVTPSDSLAAEVKKLVADGKPVVVVMGDLAASGGYYLSAPASHIIAQPGTLTGSIGVTAAWFTGEKALELLGIKADGVDLAPSAGFGDWTRPLTERDSQKWNAMIHAVYDRFLNVVAEGRDLSKEELEPLARGQIYTGREALDLGLVDELGGQEEARAWLEKELKAPVVFQDVIPGDSSPWDGLLGPLAKAVVQAADSPALQMAEALDPVAGPLAQAWAGAAARGPGPLVWIERP